MTTILVTGVAGFIGMHVAEKLLMRGDTVIGVDCLNDYYDVFIKFDRLQKLKIYNNFIFSVIDISDKDQVDELFKKHPIERLINLAAQAGVRYSIENPHSYIQNNIISTTNLLETCKNSRVKKIILASSSSVYGVQKNISFDENLKTNKPTSFYAASKIAMEAIAHSYSHIYNLPIKILRFFTVYGPWGRPDMAYFQFTKKIINGENIEVFNKGNHFRDFTYISDIVDFIVKIIKNKKNKKLFEILNLGNGKPNTLENFISLIETKLKKKSKKIYKDIQKGDMLGTCANMRYSKKNYELNAKVNLKNGIEFFIEWFKKYYNINN